jgi:hypothetical protein
MMTTSEYEKTFVERIHDHLVPSGEQRQRVTSCTDALQLDRWFDRAITAGTAAEVFAD